MSTPQDPGETPMLGILISMVAPLLMAGGVDLGTATAAARQAIDAYRTRGEPELLSAAQILGFSVMSLDSLRLSAGPEVSVTRKLRLRGNANGLSRSCQRANAMLAQQRREAAHDPPAGAGPAACTGPDEARREAELLHALAETSGLIARAQANVDAERAQAETATAAPPAAAKVTQPEPLGPDAEAANPDAESACQTAEPPGPDAQATNPDPESANPTAEPATRDPEATDPAAERANPTANSTAEPVIPTAEPANPTVGPANPTAEPANPTAEPANPAPEPTTPTREPANPTPRPNPHPMPHPNPPSETDQRLAWAGAMTHVAREFSAGLARLPQPERRIELLRIQALNDVARKLTKDSRRRPARR
jgi:hypothetical protein